ncbi:hypothetical protein CGLAU_03410 [Corynebacterium glaucum]|uniref:Uncharacterized protein n=1 Tax=Corynebacterium glaucum TaxID=187491 RepID=A0A1Q2HV06_9CORY|nr:hypothetical protein [Corynebacterium glaucum]AQQ14662.1 hypothetical protein CGLAU_03410 [Corynebacterium glaucum]
MTAGRTGKDAVELFNFAVTEGALTDADRYIPALRKLGVSVADLQRLRITIAGVSGTRRGVLEVRSGTPSLALRPLAPAPSEITVHSLPIPDERLEPGTFGPDVGWQQSQLAQLGAHEGLLVDASSRVISAIMYPLLVVEPGRVRVSSHPDTAHSIALESVLDLLGHQGVEIVEEPRGFDRGDLMDREVWVIDPVYGARLVDTWIEYGTKRPARLLFDRHGVPSHREVNEVRRRSAATV